MGMSSRVAKAVDDACDDAESFVEVSGRLADAAKAFACGRPEENQLAPFVAAFSYDYAERHSRRRDDYGAFVPMIETAAGTFPPRLDVLPEYVQSAWAEIVPLVSEPAARARLNDLLWTLRYGHQTHEYARAAVAAYRDLSERWLDIARVDALSRALELALLINDRSTAAEIVTRIVTEAREALAEAEPKPGVVLRLIHAALDSPEPPADVDDVLLTATDRFKDDMHVGDSLTDLLASRAAADRSRVEQLRRDQIQRWRALAAATQGVASLTHLEHGLELARTHGLADEARLLRQALQAFDRDSIEFEKVEAEAEVDTNAIEELVESLVERDWLHSLRAFGSTGPPSGDIAENTAVVRDLMRRYPVGFLFSRTLLGPENTVIKRLSGEEEHFAAQLAEHEARAIGFWAQISVEGLARIQARHGLPETETLVPHFSQGVIAPDCADAFARGVRLYAEGRYDESALVVISRIEAVMRELARRAGQVVIREPVGHRPGGVKSLGEVLLSLREALDESWWRYLWNTLAEPLGLNLRNRLAHGLTDGTPSSAALLLHICCFLPFLRSSS